jgi:adenylate cyclase
MTISVPEAVSSAAVLARRAVGLGTCLGRALLTRGDYEGALAEVEHALVISPNLASAHGIFGATLLR